MLLIICTWFLMHPILILGIWSSDKSTGVLFLHAKLCLLKLQNGLQNVNIVAHDLLFYIPFIFSNIEIKYIYVEIC